MIPPESTIDDPDRTLSSGSDRTVSSVSRTLPSAGSAAERGGLQYLDRFAAFLRWNPAVVLTFNRGFERLTGRFTGWAAS